MPNSRDVESVLLRSALDLKSYFLSHAKHACMHRVGVEAEFFAVYRKNGLALPYHGRDGIEAILKMMARLYFYRPVKQKKHLIGLVRKDLSVSLEPGGQVELSAPPVSTIFQIDEQVKQFVCQLHMLEKKFPQILFLSSGIQPFSSPKEIKWTPKERYAIMRRRMLLYGELSHWMMKVTGTNQANFDFSDEDDATEKMKVALLATPVVAALFSNSCFSEGKPNGYRTFRMQIWRKTDRTRSGYLTQFLKSRRIFCDYLNYVLDAPMLFVIRENRYREVRGISFRKFIAQGYQGMRATLSDFELHLTTLFPDVRLKQYLEVRSGDAQSPARITSVAALWKGLLYSQTARSAVQKLFQRVSESDLQNAYAALPREGLQAQLARRSLAGWAREVVEIARSGLQEQTTAFENRSECVFLKALEDDLKKDRAPADVFLAAWGKGVKRNRFWTLNRLRI